MRILYLSHRVPFPPNKGEKIHVFNCLKALSQYHEIHLLAFNTDRADESYRQDLLKLCKTVSILTFDGRLRKIKAGIGSLCGKSAAEAFFYSAQMQSSVNEKLAKVDLAIAEGSSMAPYVMDASCVVLSDFIDLDSEKWEKYAQHSCGLAKRFYQLEARRLRILERNIAEKAKHVFLVSPTEANLFKKQTGLGNILTLMMGVDRSHYQTQVKNSKPRLIFMGTMDYFPNIDAALFFHQKIWPLIKKKRPDVEWVLAGRNPSPELMRLEREAGIKVTGAVDDIRPYLWEASVSVVPLRIAMGIQSKILESMAAGVPIVTTSQAHEGLSAVPGRHLFVEDKPETFAKRVLELLNDAALAGKMRNEAYQYIQEYHDWEKNVKILLDICGQFQTGRLNEF